MPSAVPVSLRMVLLMFAIVSTEVAPAERKQWEELAQCRYVSNKYNDGDSFRVNCGGREFRFRFYFVDAPETGLTNGAQVDDQRAYFRVTFEDVVSAGEKANARVREILQEPFSVSTRWAVAGGRSAEPRYYGLIDVGGKRLIEVLLAEGLVRTKGIFVNLPTGEKSKAYVEKLRDLERQAKDQKRGAWEHSKE